MCSLAGSLIYWACVRVCVQALPKMQQMQLQHMQQAAGNNHFGRVQCIRMGLPLAGCLAANGVAALLVPSHVVSSHLTSLFPFFFCFKCSIRRLVFPSYPAPCSWPFTPPSCDFLAHICKLWWGKCCYQGECKSITKINPAYAHCLKKNQIEIINRKKVSKSKLATLDTFVS